MKRVDEDGRDVTGLHGLHGPTDTVTLSGEEWDAFTVTAMLDRASALETACDRLLELWDTFMRDDSSTNPLDYPIFSRIEGLRHALMAARGEAAFEAGGQAWADWNAEALDFGD